MDFAATLTTLCATPGVSGHEAQVRQVIAALWQPLTHTQRADALGSLWATRHAAPPNKKGHYPARPTLMLAAHMDVIGLMVATIEGEFLRTVPVGGMDVRVLPGQPVTVHGRQDVPGVVVLPPAFLLPKDQRDNFPPIGELLVDVGLPAARVAELVRIGDVISMATPARTLQGDLFAAPYLDNRASVLAVTAALDELTRRPHAWDVLAVATVQEEITLGGAGTAAFAAQPRLAIAIDVTHGTGPASKEVTDRTYPLGGGPVLGFGPNIHPAVFKALEQAAQRLEMPYTTEPMAGHSGTDAYAMQVARAGIPTGVVSIALRNMHTPVETVSLKDIQRVGRLLAELAATLPEDWMPAFDFDSQ